MTLNLAQTWVWSSASPRKNELKPPKMPKMVIFGVSFYGGGCKAANLEAVSLKGAKKRLLAEHVDEVPPMGSNFEI